MKFLIFYECKIDEKRFIINNPALSEAIQDIVGQIALSCFSSP